MISGSPYSPDTTNKLDVQSIDQNRVSTLVA